ncbi:IS200/IS605 family element transposase accessory protein TnpB [Acidithiobacillus caldus]|uniref:RNA-guided endonuclease TnpB family protein n=2 Tax=Acidithiobacillus caldus TaxID=33059 RepID=UPI001C067D92|nr:RNA-guided endonuclease TnpB family protein [Acidithiobacillus caldus]MBU2802788.1 IS200/IS605 family element transposase accessory protein TnpB [Acidithiobacillus caldus]
MATLVKTIKLPFLRLNQAKAEEFVRLERINTDVANRILALPKEERRKLTSKSFADVEIGSAWINQTIRNANAQTKTKRFRRLPLETNNQNWTLHRVGNTFSVSFGLLRGIKKRVPLQVHVASHQRLLEALLDGKAKAGSIKLSQSRREIWYALISVSMEVPDAESTGRWIGVDRGQNVPMAAATPDGPVVFWKAARIRHIRRVFAERRKKLQSLGKHMAVRKLENRERRIVTHINHCISKELVAMAVRLGAGIRFEDLSSIRQTTKQRKQTKSDAGQNRDYWPFYQLETFVRYKALASGVAVDKVRPHYTSKSCHRCGALNKRHKHAYVCTRCGHKAHADANAAMNIRDWYGLCCPLVLEVPGGGPHEPAPNPISQAAAFAAA